MSNLDLLIESFAALVGKTASMLDRVNHEDAFSDGLVGAWFACKTYDPSRGATLKTWVITCVRQRIWDGVQKRRRAGKANEFRQRLIRAKRENLELLADRRRRPADDLEQTESFEALLREVPEADRQLLRLRYFMGMSNKEIAAESGTTARDVSKRHQRVISLLRALWSD